MSAIVRLVATLVVLLAATAVQAENEVPTERALEALVKGSLLTLNDANVTGNYSVMHAKLSRPFREQFSVEKFRAAFKQFRVENTDYDIIAAMAPTYDPKPAIDKDGTLVVKGTFPTEPSRVRFDLEFIPSEGEWKLITIQVKMVPKS